MRKFQKTEGRAEKIIKCRNTRHRSSFDADFPTFLPAQHLLDSLLSNEKVGHGHGRESFFLQRLPIAARRTKRISVMLPSRERGLTFGRSVRYVSSDVCAI